MRTTRRPPLQLDFQPREHKPGLLSLALAAVEDLHLVVHGVTWFSSQCSM